MHQEKSVGYRFAMLLLLMIAGAMLGYIIALASIPLVFQIPFSALMGVLNMDSGLEITPAVLKYVQLILATFVFIVPANAYSHLFSDNTFVFFEFKKPSLVFLFFAALDLFLHLKDLGCNHPKAFEYLWLTDLIKNLF